MAENIRLKVKGVEGFTTYHPETNLAQVINDAGEGLDVILSDGTTSKKGLVQLTDSVTSTSITTAATPKSVKAAYDLADGKAAKTLATTTADGLMSKADKDKLNKLDANAAPNQNAFSNFKVGAVTVAAETVTDTLELVAGTNVVLTPDATTDKITISLGAAVETTTGAQAKATKTLEDAKEYVNTTVSANAGSLEGMNWKYRMGAL